MIHVTYIQLLQYSIIICNSDGLRGMYPMTHNRVQRYYYIYYHPIYNSFVILAPKVGVRVLQFGMLVSCPSICITQRHTQELGNILRKVRGV